MRILFLTQVLPYPLDAGPKIRAYYTLRHLAQRHEVVLLSFVRASDARSAIEHLETFCETVWTVPMSRSRAGDLRHLLRSLIGNTPFLIARDWDADMASTAGALARSADRRFDAVHADQLWMAPYALLAADTDPLAHRPRLVLDQHNAVFQIPRRLAQHEPNPLKRALLRLESRKLARFEASICDRFDHVVWVTEEDRAALFPLAEPSQRTRGSHSASTVIPICVAPSDQEPLPRSPEARRVLFLGGLHWPPNAAGIAWFAREVWDLVRQRVPEARLTIVGRDPPSALRKEVSRQSGIEVTGYVSDLSSYLAETAVFVVPLEAGGGMRVKILDAWCWGLPVVSTPIGAEGLAVADGRNLLLASTAESFANAVVRLLQDPELAQHLAIGGRGTVQSHYDWRATYRSWDEIYPS